MAKGDTVHGAHNDDVNQVYSMLGVIGTLGTADAKGSALTLPVGVDPSTGAAYVYNLGPAGTTTPAGTQDVNVVGGTLTTSVASNLPVIAGTPDNAGTVLSVRLSDGTSYYTASAGGSFTNVASGTQQTLGTVGTIPGIGVVSLLTDGTVAVKTPGTITSGTISVNTPGTITSGSISVTTGTIGTVAGVGLIDGTVKVNVVAGGAGGGVADLQIRDESGTTWVDVGVGTSTAGTYKVPVSGTVTVGNINTIGTLQSGTVSVVTPGTITSGTVSVNTPGTITSGSIAITDGTVKVVTPGTITSGSIAITAGTIGGKAASGAAAVANPVQIGGTDAGGTIYSPLVNTAGAWGSVANIGTIKEAGTVTGIGVVSNVTNGSIVVTAGTVTVGNIGTIGTIQSGTVAVNTPGTITSGSIAVTAGTVVLASPGTITSGTVAVSLGTVGGKAASGAAAIANPITIAGTDSGGTVYSPLINTAGAGTVSGVGTIPGVGIVTTVTNITNGTIQNSGTVTGVGTIPGIGVVTNITNGTIQNSGTVTGVGTIPGIGVVSNLTNGSIKVTAGTFGGGGANAAATVGFPNLIAGMDAGGTAYTFLADTTRRLHMVQQVGTLNTGTINAGTINAGTVTMTLGTVNSGTINSGTINVGSISGRGANAAATVGFPVLVAGMDTGGTAYTQSVDTNGHQQIDVQTGTVTLVTTVTNLTNGTIQNSGTVTGVGTVPGVGVVSNLTNGSIKVTAGTEIVTSGTINLATVTMTLGTLNAGTINSGTINAGTIRDDGRPARNILSFATTVALAGSAYGTVIGSASVGAGTSLWVNDVSLLNNGGTVICDVGFGTFNSGSASLFRGLLGAREGIQKSYPKAVNCGMTNSDLTVWSNAAATVDIALSYFISA